METHSEIQKIIAVESAKATYSQNSIVFTDSTAGYKEIKCDIGGSRCYVDTESKHLIFEYGGHFPDEYSAGLNLKEKGVTVQDANGENVDFIGGEHCSIIIPYNNLTDIATLYFCFSNQQIEIAVTQ